MARLLAKGILLLVWWALRTVVTEFVIKPGQYGHPDDWD